MILLADAGVDRPIVDYLRSEGHLVHYVAEMQPNIPDDIVLNLSVRYGAILLTLDKDFGNLIYRQGRASNGVILIRLGGIPIPEKVSIIADLMKNHANELLGAFTVVTRQTIRIRPAP